MVGGCRGGCCCIGVSPMDENSPLSPKANAFSIASLISVAAAAEHAGKGALEERSGGRSAPARPAARTQKMHFSTVTRDMEGERGAAGPRPSAIASRGFPRAAAGPGTWGRSAVPRALNLRCSPPSRDEVPNSALENRARFAPPRPRGSPRRCGIPRRRRRAWARPSPAPRPPSGPGAPSEITREIPPGPSRCLPASGRARGSLPLPGRPSRLARPAREGGRGLRSRGRARLLGAFAGLLRSAPLRPPWGKQPQSGAAAPGSYGSTAPEPGTLPAAPSPHGNKNRFLSLGFSHSFCFWRFFFFFFLVCFLFLRGAGRFFCRDSCAAKEAFSRDNAGSWQMSRVCKETE